MSSELGDNLPTDIQTRSAQPKAPSDVFSRWHSLQTTLVVALGLLAAAASAAVGTTSFRATKNTLEREVDRSVAQSIQTAANRGERRGPGDRQIPERPAETASRLAANPVEVTVVENITAVASVTLAEATVAIEDLPRPAIGEVRLRTLEIEGDPYRVGVTSLVSGGIVAGIRDVSEVRRVLHDLRDQIIANTVLVALGGAALGWLLAARISRRLRQLAMSAASIARSPDLNVEIPVEGRDEAAVVAATLRDTLGSLRQSRAQQQRLVQDAGHELRTPLTSVRTNIAMLRKFDRLDAAQQQGLVTDLEDETAELVELVNELVELATDRREDEAPSRVDLRALADDVADRASRRSGRPVTVNGSSAHVLGPRQGIERAIGNLVSNALKFDSTGGPIDVVVDQGQLSVRDRGPGIAPAERDLVFERFYRADAARATAGSGLGLAIVADVATRCGGTTFVAERAGGGTEIGIRIPLAE